MKQRLWLGLALAHLFLVVCGAARWPLFAKDSIPGQALRHYGTLSGSDNGYHFFAPGVATQMRPRFLLEDEAGNTWSDTLESTLSHEAQLRIGGAIGLIAEFPGVYDQLAASWGATILGRHPSATRVTVLLDVMMLPTMPEYFGGAAKTWAQDDYVVVVERKG